MSEIALAPARPRDARAIALASREWIESGLSWRYTPRRVAELIAHPDVLVLVARAPSRLVAFAALELDFQEHRAHLVLLAVEPEGRRQGIGSALLAWMEPIVRLGGIEWISLEVRATMLEARAFYRAHGYVELGSQPGYYDGREDAIRMERAVLRPVLPA